MHLDLPQGAERWTAKHRDHDDAAALVQNLGRLAREHRLHEHARGAVSDDASDSVSQPQRATPR